MTFDIKRMMVTGANGFVGHALCTEALLRDMSVIGVIRDGAQLPTGVQAAIVSNIDGTTDWQHALSGRDVVIHLAARVHVMRETSDNPLAEFRRLNVAGTEHLARSAAVAGVKRLVYVSSIGVNGLHTSMDISFSEQDVPSPHNAYAVTKWEAEQALQRIAKETGLEVVIVRPPLVYGAGQKVILHK